MGLDIRQRRIVLGVFSALALSAGATVAADFTIIANKSTAASSIGKADLQSIFLGEKTRWDDGKPIKIVVLDEGEVHKAFLQQILGKTPSQFDSYWKRLVFTGKASVPKSFGDASKLIDFVAEQAGTVGYVSAGQAGSSVKILSVK
jgi:ABC-type phosphate transport system substrate-binding protein